MLYSLAIYIYTTYTHTHVHIHLWCLQKILYDLQIVLYWCWRTAKRWNETFINTILKTFPKQFRVYIIFFFLFSFDFYFFFFKLCFTTIYQTTIWSCVKCYNNFMCEEKRRNTVYSWKCHWILQLKIEKHYKKERNF